MHILIIFAGGVIGLIGCVIGGFLLGGFPGGFLVGGAIGGFVVLVTK